jgi:hypothetical protein
MHRGDVFARSEGGINTFGLTFAKQPDAIRTERLISETTSGRNALSPLTKLSEGRQSDVRLLAPESPLRLTTADGRNETVRINKLFSGFLAIIFTGLLGQPASASENSSAQSRTLIIYFSQPEEMKPDAVDGFSGASVLQKNTPETGSTQFIAQLVQKQTHGDLFRIETTTAYPRQHDALLRVAEKEQQTKARPALKRRSPHSAITTPFTSATPSGGTPCPW